ncbi:pentatricopeptide repeat-containing protein At3g53170-like [Coffea eugenioides]|uniref:pentatricopeptide repeat-containing protein At3g53170-like n=1 Tax=Coffea eugenioides TaxID=49369 RepID=UPI000F615527|nr:pentatricopeptide repeat-containing protein At3g53170-like [Coffea eugenioides]XP_027157832.1 pentatricopeptide repeat-containing protein At3g53170-like [Coffea eugenioides]XP_027157833.1 pentatricopeptide repeat-containing protein At3g53170-like [Coffea eugenioides]
MELHLVDPANLRLFSSIHHPRTPKFSTIKSSKKDSITTSKGLQKSSQKELSRILRSEAATKNIVKKANSNKYNNLNPKAVLDALDDAIKGNDWESALKIFSLLRKQRWYIPKGQTYTKLLVMLGKCKQPNHAGLLFEIMESDGLQPTIDVYTALVGVYGFSGLLDKAFHTVDEMKSVSDCKPDVYTYSILIKCCAKLRRFDMIGIILAEMSYLGIECNATIYNTVIDGYGKAGLFEQMEHALSDMIESGTCLPDIYTFNSVIGAFGNFGQIDKVESWFDQFQLMGIKPDIMTFNILVRSYGKASMYEKMGSVLDFMKKRFYSPTIVTFNIVIETYGKAGNVEKMEEYFLKMKHQGMKPNSITYCSLVSAYSKSGLLDKVDSIIRQADNTDVILDTPFFNCVISAYGRAGNIEKMVELFSAMEDQQCKPDSITFASMIQAYQEQGMIEAAQELEHKMLMCSGSSEVKLIGSWRH